MSSVCKYYSARPYGTEIFLVFRPRKKIGSLGTWLPGNFWHLVGNFVVCRKVFASEIKKWRGGRFWLGSRKKCIFVRPCLCSRIWNHFIWGAWGWDGFQCILRQGYLAFENLIPWPPKLSALFYKHNHTIKYFRSIWNKKVREGGRALSLSSGSKHRAKCTNAPYGLYRVCFTQVQGLNHYFPH